MSREKDVPVPGQLAHPVPPEAPATFPDLVPIPEGETKVLVNAFTVDATLIETEEGATWEIITRLRLYNSSPTEPASVRLSLSTSPNTPFPTDLRMAEGREAARAVPFTAKTYQRMLQPDQRLWLTFAYTVPVRDKSWTWFHYGVDRLQQWPTVVGSVRVSLHLPFQLSRSAFLLISPETTSYNGLLVEWQWEERVPPVPTDVLLVRPAVWRKIETLRAEHAAGDLTATARLARILTDMAVAEDAPTQVVDAFYPEALGLWADVAERRADDPQPWREMAALYEARGRRSGEQDTYSALALAALEEAWARGDRDEVTRRHLADVIRQQVEHLIAEARWQDALSALGRLQEIVGDGGTAEAVSLRRQIALAWAQERAQAGDREGLMQALAVGWDEAVVSYFLPRQPPIRYLTVEVTTGENTRNITITAALDPTARPDPRETWETFTRLLRAALPDGDVETENQGSLVRVRARITFADAEDLLTAQRRIAGVVPDRPEWSLVRAALSPARLEMSRVATIWGWRYVWKEEVDFTPVRSTLDEMIVGLRAALAAPPSPDFPEELVPLLKAQRESDLLAWQGLRDEMAAVYVLRWDDPPGPPLARRWQLSPGEHIIMQGERPRLDIPRVVMLLGALLLGWTLVTLALWWGLGRAR